MNNIKKLSIFISLIAAVGLIYAIFVFKNIPESFDWNLDEDDDYEF